MEEGLTDMEYAMGGSNTHLSGVPEGNSRANGDQAIVQENKREFSRTNESYNP